MKIRNAELVISAVRPNQYPTTKLDEFALLGRSNVGKSSFINKMLGRKNLAYTSNTPGKTQTINFYEIDSFAGDFRFVDMPGYGYAKVSKKERERFGKMIEDYLLKREELKDVFLLVDSRVGPTEDDVMMYDWLEYYDIQPVIIATKVDKLKKSQREEKLENIREVLGMKQDEILIPFSKVQEDGYEEVWDKLQKDLTET